MINIIIVFVVLIVLVWLLFVRGEGKCKLLSPLRWLLVAWGVLVCVTFATPISFNTYKLTWEALGYATLWVAAFAYGERLGEKAKHFLPKAYQGLSPFMDHGLIGLAGIGCIILIIGNWSTLQEVIANPFAIAMRREYFAQEGSSLVTTIGTFLAMGGVIPALREIASAILRNRPVRALSYIGIGEYLLVYILGAGRQGFALLAVAVLALCSACLSLRGFRYKHWKVGALCGSLIVLAAVGYNIFIITYRSTGMTGSVEWKMDYQNGLYDATLDPDFRDFALNTGAFGAASTEAFYYLSPQLYGLGYTLENYRGQYSWGALQFPYFARRIEQLTKQSITMGISDRYDDLYNSGGLFWHFFRTAAEDCFMDFGMFGGIIFTLICGIFAGRSYGAASKYLTAELIAEVSYICAGSAFTVNFSPFCELGFAFPVMWICIRRIIESLFGNPTSNRHRSSGSSTVLAAAARE